MCKYIYIYRERERYYRKRERERERDVYYHTYVTWMNQVRRLYARSAGPIQVTRLYHTMKCG